MESAALNQQGLMAGYQNSGMMGYTAVIIAVNLKILLFTNTFNVLVGLGILFSIVSFVGSFKISSLLWFSADYKEYGV